MLRSIIPHSPVLPVVIFRGLKLRIKTFCSHAVSDGVPLRSFTVALIVGTILNLINQGDALLGASAVNWFKVALTYCVPYAVCTYGAVMAKADMAC